MHPDYETIKQLDLFEGLTSEQIDDIISICYTTSVFEGEKLIREGDEANNLYISLSGDFMLHADDGRAMTIHEGGAIMGVSYVTGPLNYQINVTALTEGMVMVIPGEAFQQIIDSHTDLGQKIISIIEKDIEIRKVLMDGHDAGPVSDEVVNTGEN
jgi:CRP-like cAMP-binding protein